MGQKGRRTKGGSEKDTESDGGREKVRKDSTEGKG
jgi:hypothetical protein